jgi:hypothetical protein
MIAGEFGCQYIAKRRSKRLICTLLTHPHNARYSLPGRELETETAGQTHPVLGANDDTTVANSTADSKSLIISLSLLLYLKQFESLQRRHYCQHENDRKVQYCTEDDATRSFLASIVKWLVATSQRIHVLCFSSVCVQYVPYVLYSKFVQQSYGIYMPTSYYCSQTSSCPLIYSLTYTLMIVIQYIHCYPHYNNIFV